jgi:hypothetical protein
MRLRGKAAAVRIPLSPKAANMTNATFRFHQIRPGERWNLPDLDQFRLDKIIEIDTEPAASASPKPQHRQRAAGHLGS